MTMDANARTLSRAALLSGAAAAALALPIASLAATPARAQHPDLARYLWLSRPETRDSIRAPFTLDGVHIYKKGYYELCVAFRDISVDPTIGYVQIDPRLIDALWEIQQYYFRNGVSRPIEIYSGFRTPAHNELVGGASRSFHPQARAVDFGIPGIPPKHTGAVALALPSWLVGGVGIYADDDHVHIDTGPRAGRVWCNHDEHTCSAAEI